MTINTNLYNWQRSSENWDAPPYEQASPNLVALRDYLMDRWGGVSLGIHGDRPIRKGASPSSHAYGAALDWRWGWHQDFPTATFITREVLEAEVIPFLIEWSLELGVQAIHDQGRIWRADRPGTELDGEWVKQNTGYGPWLHIETTKQAWSDSVPVATRLEIAKDQPPPVPEPMPIPPFAPDLAQWSLWPLASKRTLKLGLPGGDDVRYLQGVIAHKAGGRVLIDGLYGMATETRVREVQRFFGLHVDGVVGPATWRLIDWLATR